MHGKMQNIMFLIRISGYSHETSIRDRRDVQSNQYVYVARARHEHGCESITRLHCVVCVNVVHYTRSLRLRYSRPPTSALLSSPRLHIVYHLGLYPIMHVSVLVYRSVYVYLHASAKQVEAYCFSLICPCMSVCVCLNIDKAGS